MANAFRRYGERVRQAVAPVVLKNLSEMHETAAALTPVRTGRMRSLLREEPTGGGMSGFVGWVAEDFKGEAQEFYVPPVVLGHQRKLADGTLLHVPANDPLTPAAEQQRPVFTRDVAEAIRGAAQG